MILVATLAVVLICGELLAVLATLAIVLLEGVVR